MTVDLAAAADFVHRSARLLERHRFAHLMEATSAAPVLAALRAYRNPDGGFGHALEPDVRAPGSQTFAVQSALEILHEVGVHDDPMIAPAADFLQGMSNPDGGIPFALPSAGEYPHAQHVRPTPESSLIQTAANAAALHALGADHPWLGPAGELCFERLAALELGRDAGAGYGLRFGVWFLDAVPDSDRAGAALDSLAERLHGSGVVAEPGAGGDVQTPLDISPWPNGRSRRLFDAETIERDLDALEAGQQDDGGWTFAWPAWNPAAAFEWRGIVTVHALRVLRAHGRA